jgi:hypothetical protein
MGLSMQFSNDDEGTTPDSATTSGQFSPYNNITVSGGSTPYNWEISAREGLIKCFSRP